jgi:LacI family transcriptional regulator
VLISPHSAATDIARLRAAGIPVVVIDRPLASDGGDDLDSVMVESTEGARRATAHLLAEGWQRPGCVTGPADAATAEQRLAGYRAALADHGVDREFVARAEFRQAGGRAATAQLLDGLGASGALDEPGASSASGTLDGPGGLGAAGAVDGPAASGVLGASSASGASGAADPDDRPDSLFVANAPMALGMLEEVKRRGLRIGVDLGVVVFDDAPWAPFIEPPMTVIAQPAYEIGATATELLVARIRGTASAGARSIVLETSLEVRASSVRRAPPA